MAKSKRRGVLLVAVIPVVAPACLLYIGRMPQDVWLPGYHRFADRRTVWGVPNCWNVVSNLRFWWLL